MKKRILIFSTAYLPLIGGAEIAVKEITDRLGDDFEFDLICARIKKSLLRQERIGAIDIWRVGRGWGKFDKFLLSWQGFKLAKQLYVKQKYDAVWAIMASFGGLAALFFKEQFSGVPYILTLQEGDTARHIASRAKWLGPYYKRMFKEANFITAISQYLKEYAIKNGAICTIEIVPNGVSVKKFSPNVILSPKGEESPRLGRGDGLGQAERSFANAQDNKKEKLKDSLGIKENDKVIITVSRLVEKNGVGDLIKAVALLPENYKLLILGGGALEKSLKFKVRSLKLEDKILFLGEISPDEVPKYLAISDVFVRSSLAEGLGNVFLEAMAAGVPIVGTPVGGIPDFLTNGETGLFCKVRNPASIAEKINQILSDENLRQKLISNGKKLVTEKYDWAIIAPKMGKIFKRLINH
jgi:glycosyltransferase involved in cell wall biosynthesis